MSAARSDSPRALRTRAAAGRRRSSTTDGPTPHGDAAGERLALVVEAIREGYLLHYGDGRVSRTDDPDLALLAGDRLYALGLERLAALGDLDAVVALADLISMSAKAHAEGDPARADASWEAGVSALARRRAIEFSPLPDRNNCSCLIPLVNSRRPSTRSTAVSRARSRARPSPAAG